ncbi:alpha/beta hydrolase fold domain-containing protein [Actinoplanes sp. L3-i22]|uniref:alpha/beta hydrolase fold domain-containing protein n=1 Tax=Actinoplanes sp. L3-i22 TaxID=2836373 RepID=UPI001C75AEB3|nr:alpha/beta hydrolase fold domain-containing protein [Actinoplanes sp. L3-i22]BCY14175.1 hypothetical protein L3i22_092630 [Actinoplanes sp. L3-i22]
MTELDDAARRLAEGAAHPPYLYAMGPGDARLALGLMQAPPELPAGLEHRTVEIKSGPVHLLIPPGAVAAPIILYVHGGGWVLGDWSTHHRLAVALSRGTGAVVVMPEYARVPEARYPVAIEQLVAVLAAIRDGSLEVPGDRRRIALAGDCAGATLALSLAIRDRDRSPTTRDLALATRDRDSAAHDPASTTRDRDSAAHDPASTTRDPALATRDRGSEPADRRAGRGPSDPRSDGDLGPAAALVAQVLLYPIGRPGADDPSAIEFATGAGLRLADVRRICREYAPRGEAGADPLAATELAGLPATLLITAEADVTRDRAEDFGNRLRAAGVPVVGSRYLGTVHDFAVLDSLRWTPAARAAVTQVTDYLRAAFTAAGGAAPSEYEISEMDAAGAEWA